MRKSTSKIITVALVMIAAVSTLASLPKDKKHNTDNILLNEPATDEKETFEVTLETLPPGLVAGTKEPTEAPTEPVTEAPTIHMYFPVQEVKHLRLDWIQKAFLSERVEQHLQNVISIWKTQSRVVSMFLSQASCAD